jgi:uncharacterized protein (TIGR00369 family)
VDEPRIKVADFQRLLDETAPLSRMLGVRAARLGYGTATLVLPGDPAWTRAGGSVSGPAMMALADTALYAAVLSRIGLEPMALTSELTIHFLRRPEPRDLFADASLLRLGRRTAVGEVRLHDGDAARLVAHVTGSYALPATVVAGAPGSA